MLKGLWIAHQLAGSYATAYSDSGEAAKKEACEEICDGLMALIEDEEALREVDARHRRASRGLSEPYQAALPMTPAELRAAREAALMTQAALAKALALSGKTPSATVRAWESGRRPISGPVAIAVNCLLNHPQGKGCAG